MPKCFYTKSCYFLWILLAENFELKVSYFSAIAETRDVFVNASKKANFQVLLLTATIAPSLLD